MFAVATQNPDAVPETYVRQHIRTIAPDDTVVVYWDGSGRSLEGLSAFKINARHAGAFGLSSKMVGMWNIVFDTYAGAIVGEERKRLIRYFEENRVSALLAEFGPTGCALREVCREKGIKLVVNFHGYDATVMGRRWIIRRAYHRLARDAAHFVCGSKHFSKILVGLGIPQEKISVIPCGIEPEYFNGNRRKEPMLAVAVGRLTEKKAPHLTIDAFALVKKKMPSARLEIIGDGPLRAVCERKIEELDIQDCVKLHGAKDHEFVAETLSRASVFVQHSVTASNGDTESQGISLLEAMASSVPVVTTRHNGFPETVADGVTGFLVDEGDIRGMAEKVVALFSDIDVRKAMGAAGRERVLREFSAEGSIKQLRELLL